LNSVLLDTSFRDPHDDRVRVKDDFKILAQCECELISHLISEDASTLAKYLDRACETGLTTTKTVLLRDGFDAAWFENVDILPAINGGDYLYRTAISDRIGLRRLIQQNAYLSDSHGDGELPEISVLDSDCLMAEKFGIFLAPGAILSSGVSLDLGVNPEACARKRVMALAISHGSAPLRNSSRAPAFMGRFELARYWATSAKAISVLASSR
jgi:hypothetical protein